MVIVVLSVAHEKDLTSAVRERAPKKIHRQTPETLLDRLFVLRKDESFLMRHPRVSAVRITPPSIGIKIDSSHHANMINQIGCHR